MAGSLNLFDAQWLTADSESRSREGIRVDTLQIHHTAGTNLYGARSLMDPGGRTVSSNGLLAQDGRLFEVVPLSRRALTSATSHDRRSLTVETVNISGAPRWGIAHVQRERLARLAVQMFRAGLLGGFHRGLGGIIVHSEVPGTYATACAGPDMQADWIAARAREINATTTGLDLTPTTVEPKLAPVPEEDIDMVIINTQQHGIYLCAPGTVVHHRSDRMVKLIKDGWLTKAPTIYDVAPSDLAEFLFSFSGVPADEIPAPGHTWSLAA